MYFSSKAYAGFGIVSSVMEGLYQDVEAVVMNERGSSILACGCGGGGGVRRFSSWKAGGRFDGDEDGWQDGFMVVGCGGGCTGGTGRGGTDQDVV